ncbi:hypothetical protein Athai_38240 [Actinocatenispora thailandica]|uniref:PucR family transcriptional regulator n=1 Tax=Actinocatenispora thailandica TaxID=227318 RepID=A0A7R7HY84_9ACTN|nr:PucR family transcriptional regulator [Actinocatenispora thailandica]BCJ36321.1 hypothetical protein Athai_38240 [Actinocatenispora thailandica]
MRLAQLIDLDELALRVVVPAGLTRRVRWVYTTDLRDPARYMAGGELVLTSLSWYRGAADAGTFVASLCRARAAGLVAGLAEHGEMPAGLVQACRAEGLALLTVPVQTSFNFLTETVIRLLLRERRRHADLTAELVGSGTEPDPDRLVSLVAAGAGGCLQLTPAGLVLRSQPGPAGPALRASAWRAGIDAPGLPVTVSVGDTPHTVVPILAQDAGRLTGYLVVPGESTDWPDDLAATVEVTVDALGAVAPAAPDRRGDALHELASAPAAEFGAGDERPPAPGDATTGAVPAARVDAPELPETVVVLRAGLTGPATPTAVARRILAELPGGPAATVAHPDGTVTGYLPAGTDPTAAVLDRLDWYRTALAAGDRLRVGISEPARVDTGLPAARSAADSAYGWTERGTGRLTVAARQAVGSRQLLLGLVPEPARSAHRDRWLAPLLAHDRVHGSDLVPTLAAFLDRSGSWRDTAAALHVHVNTVRYRLRQAERLIGRPLRTERDRLDLHLAMDLWRDDPPARP